MARVLFALAFGLGALAILWMSWIFLGTDVWALLITLAIGVAYSVGFIELNRFRGATAQLQDALNRVGASADNLDFDAWIKSLPRALQYPVRRRIEGDKIGLPAPVLTPYLVGLLVMLGLLGTFVGMVDTLKGAVVALEGSAELQAIRDGLAAPIKGLGFAFGTSVAGVAASAVLGLVSTLCRRERLYVVRQLDGKIPTAFRDFSLVYGQQQAFEALQSQVQALPDVAAQMAEVAQQLAQMGQSLGDQMATNQSEFHSATEGVYRELASSVGQSLRDTITESGRLTGESIKPVVEDVMTAISREIREGAEKSFSQLAESSDTYFKQVASSLDDNTQKMQGAIEAGLQQQQTITTELLSSMADNADSTVQRFETLTQQSLESQGKASRETIEAVTEQSRSSADGVLEEIRRLLDASESLVNTRIENEQVWQQGAEQRLEKIAAAVSTELKALRDDESDRATSAAQQLQNLVEQTSNQLKLLRDAETDRAQHAAERATALSATTIEELQSLRQTEEQHSEAAVERMSHLTASITSELKALRDAEEQRNDAAVERLGALTSAVSEQLQKLHDAEEQRNDAAADRLAGLTAATTEQLQKLHDAEALRSEAAAERLAGLAGAASEQLQKLRDEEQQRGDKAVERMAGLQSAVTEHLGQLGNSLEAPMTRLIETASETPKAAAEVIAQLREEISKNIERDNTLLEERKKIMEELSTLSNSMEQASVGQRQAAELLVNSSTEMLQDVGSRFSDQLQGEVSRLNDMVDQFSGSAVEMASLGEAFGEAVTIFNDSNMAMIENLNRIEEALEKSNTRSDEQLGYYVAQAREIIDHSMMSQKEVFEEIRQLSRKAEEAAAEA